jgi:glycerol kinase
VTDDRPYVLALDQGTSATKAVAVGADGRVLAVASVPLAQQHPAPGQVEQDATEILDSVHRAAEAVIEQVGDRVLSVGLSVQRESALVWDRRTGRPASPLLGWQDRRTSGEAVRMRESGQDARVRELSGLPVDPMFSALKLRWLLDEAEPGADLAGGTIDAFLTQALCGQAVHEVGSASRTQLLDVRTGRWSEELLDAFGVPRSVLGEVVPSDHTFGTIATGPLVGRPLHAVLGDSHAALFGHGVRTPGAVKVTYGTGSSVLGLSPADAAVADGVVRTIAWGRGEELASAFEGNILATGATLVWLSRLLGITPQELARLAEEAPAEHGIDLVPAFAGLAAPWWDPAAVGLISGIDQGTGRAEIARAACESVVLQVDDVLTAAEASGQRIDTIRADGGPSGNRWLMQLQADLSGRVVVPSSVPELSALGAAHLAGLAAGVWTQDDLPGPGGELSELRPRELPGSGERRARWRGAVERSRHQPHQEER